MSKQEIYYDSLINNCWKKIAPFWPLKNVVAVNPLHGLEDLSIEEAFVQAEILFQQNNIPNNIKLVNKETIKWLQVLLDDYQSTIKMPCRELSLYNSFKKLIYYDKKLHKNNNKKRDWLDNLPEVPYAAIEGCFRKLNIVSDKDKESIINIALFSLSGWASYIKYLAEWNQNEEKKEYYNSIKIEYIAIRLIIIALLVDEIRPILHWYDNLLNTKENKTGLLENIKDIEDNYLNNLIGKLKNPVEKKEVDIEAQLIFCIDVRSEPFRRILEKKGAYETFGFAGFFGLSIKIANDITKESYSSCPVLINPTHKVSISVDCNGAKNNLLYTEYRRNFFKGIYQSLKYNFTSPFFLAESLGLFSGVWMGLRTFFPLFAIKLRDEMKKMIRSEPKERFMLDDISFDDQCNYAYGALKMMGIINNFAPIIVFCGHGSQTQNNAFSAALDCGACGGNSGGNNAYILAAILNNQEIRKYLKNRDILIPKDTCFLAAQHNTTTDEVKLYKGHIKESDILKKIEKLELDLASARKENNANRSEKLGFPKNTDKSSLYTKLSSSDWAQVRPEWGLAKNASFIVGPRDITKNIDLQGRSFLHSYDYNQDEDNSILTTILTAPMIVAQWINCQYLFSTLDNVSYGAGSKVTKNITGKIGIMQGNASDLMSGLPLQSVNIDDKINYHQPIRLITIVCAPKEKISQVIGEQLVLQKLFGNGWVRLISIDPSNKSKIYILNRKLHWNVFHEQI
jgi:uncharacterized protein